MFGTFRGGVHPNDAKTDTRDKPTEMLPPSRTIAPHSHRRILTRLYCL